MFPTHSRNNRWIACRILPLAWLALVSLPSALALQGTVITPVTITSPGGSPINFSLYLPPGHTPGGTARYPVIYHLHGIGGRHDGNQIRSVPTSHEAAVAAGLIEPAIIVFPDAYTDSFWANSANSSKPAESDVLAIISHVDASYRTRASRQSRAMQGFSMGGFGAAKFAAKYPDLFCVCVIYDAALIDWAVAQQSHPLIASEVFNNSSTYFDQYSPWYWVPRNAATLQAGVPFRQVVGVLKPNNERFRDVLAANGITPSYVQTTAPHDLQPLLDQGGAGSWAFISAAFAQNPPAPPPTGTTVPAATPRTFAASAGLYGLLPTNIAATHPSVATFLNHPHFSGVSVRTYWRDLQPTQGGFNWSYYDAVIAAAQAKNKRVILRLEAAWASPQWVLNAVQNAGGPLYEYFERNQETTPDVKEKMPAPWDATYLGLWQAFVTALGARYNGNPAVAGVLISGCSRSTEMYLPVFPAEGGPDWSAAPFNYTPQKLIASWQGVIDAFARAFPDKPIGLSLSKPLADDDVVEAVAAYGVTEYPWHFYAKISYWGNANDPAFFPTAAFLEVADEYTHGGLEPAGAAQADVTGAAVSLALSWHTLGIFEVYLAQRDNFTALKAAIDTHRNMIEQMSLGVTAQSGQVQLSWTVANPGLYPQGFKILRLVGDFPAGINDPAAKLVYEGNASGSATENNSAAEATWYYSVYDKSTGYTLAQVTAATVPATLATPVTPTLLGTSTPVSNPAPVGSGGGGAHSIVFLGLLAAAGAIRAKSLATGRIS